MKELIEICSKYFQVIAIVILKIIVMEEIVFPKSVRSLDSKIPF
jgi:hypothetical protein